MRKGLELGDGLPLLLTLQVDLDQLLDDRNVEYIAVLELKEDREIYLVSSELRPLLTNEPTFSGRALFTCINRQNDVFLWPIRLPSPEGRRDEWSRTASEAAMMGKDRWVRITANMSLGAYDVHEASGDLLEPSWPEKSLQELIRIAFKDRMIDTADHPVLKRLRGEE